jgi:RHS repeat-associated protein
LTYDALDRLSRVDYADGSFTTYTWDAGNRLTQIVDSITGTITRTPDLLDRLTQEVTPQGTVSWGYDNANRRTSMTVLGQTALSYTYDTADRLTNITQGTASVTIGYDDANRRTSLTLPNTVQATYGYDTSNRLTSITFKKGATTLGTLTYTYDAAGRRTALTGTWARTGLPAAVASASYNANNQQTAWGGQTNTFDLNGNLTSDGTNTYTWDARDRLASISGGTTASFTYDPTGRRVSKTIAGTTTQFLYDGPNPVQELSGAGAVLANLLTGLGIDEYFTRTDGSGRRSLLADALGSILALTDDAGTVQTSYTYEPFGNTTVSGQANSNSFQYTGRENDGTGLFYYRARYYIPTFGRFAQEDPLGNRAGPNLYTYGENAPVNNRDPLGLQPLPPEPPPIDPHAGGCREDNIADCGREMSEQNDLNSAINHKMEAFAYTIDCGREVRVWVCHNEKKGPRSGWNVTIHPRQSGFPDPDVAKDTSSKCFPRIIVGLKDCRPRGFPGLYLQGFSCNDTFYLAGRK